MAENLSDRVNALAQSYRARDFGNGSKYEELRVSKSCPLCPNKRTSIRRGVTSLMGHNRTHAVQRAASTIGLLAMVCAASIVGQTGLAQTLDHQGLGLRRKEGCCVSRPGGNRQAGLKIEEPPQPVSGLLIPADKPAKRDFDAK